MQNWNFDEYESIEYRGQNQQAILYFLSQQNIIFPIQGVKNHILLCFRRNQAIRLTQLIQLNHKSIVQVSPMMRLKIIELCTLKLLFLKDKQMLSAPLCKNNIWLVFQPQEEIIITQIHYDVIITDGQIRSFILELWNDLFFESKWQSTQNPINIAYNQLSRGFDLSQIKFQFELLHLFDIQEGINFQIDSKVSKKFSMFIRLIQELKFEFLHKYKQSITQYRSLILNELINEYSKFVQDFRFKSALTLIQFQELLIQKLKIGAIQCLLERKGTDFIISQNFQNLQEINDYCFKNSFFDPLISLNQRQRMDVIHQFQQNTLSSILSELYHENKSQVMNNEAITRYFEAFQTNIGNKIQNHLLNLQLTPLLKDMLIVNTFNQENIRHLQQQFFNQIKKLSQAELVNFETIMNNYMDRNNEQLEQAISKSKQLVMEMVIQSLEHGGQL